MKICIRQCRLYRADLHTRMPFRYGIATLTHLPHVFLRVTAEVDGTLSTGTAADHLPPKWFTKDPDAPPDAEIATMLRVIRQAMALAEGLEGQSVFALWRQLYDAQAAWGEREKLAPLLVNFGTSLVERALIDATCRAAARTFGDLLRENALGVTLGEIHPDLAGLNPADLLPRQPLRRILARHTVGLSDPLTDAEIPDTGRLGDGLPQSLEACIRSYGLRHFKIKIGGDVDQDVERLHRIAEVITACAPGDFAFTLDGNEQYTSLANFRGLWETLQNSARLREFLPRLWFVEQPLHRDVALSPEVREGFAAWPDRPPVIIDESDATLDSLPTALELGYAGTSHKNCKGVFKGIANACLLAHLRREQPERPVVMSGEDLTNIGPVALQQDLAVMATLGIESVERNGHHYFAGLSQFPESVQRQVLEHHSDLYRRSLQGWPTVAIEQGALRLDSALAAPFGVGFDLDMEAFAEA